MNSTNINAILEAAGELDNEVLENAFRKRKKKPIALIVVAAAAAALSVLAGFAVAYKNNVLVNGEPVFDYNITIHDEVTLLSEDEISEMNVSFFHYQDTNAYEYAVTDIDPRDLISKYNITTLGNNGNFSRADNKGYSTHDRDEDEYLRLFLSRTRVGVADDYHVDGMYGSYVSFIYWLSDDKFNIPVNFRVMCMTGNYSGSLTQEFTSMTDSSDIAYIDLNNNEKAVIHQTNYGDRDISCLATFTYDGMIYDIHADTDIEGMKQIFIDLGIVS